MKNKIYFQYFPYINLSTPEKRPPILLYPRACVIVRALRQVKFAGGVRHVLRQRRILRLSPACLTGDDGSSCTRRGRPAFSVSGLMQMRFDINANNPEDLR